MADDALTRTAKAEAAGLLTASAAAGIRRWLTEAPFARYRDRLVRDIDAERWKALDDAFYAVIEFGTGGRRGRMYPVGTNVLNERTIAESAKGLADYVSARKGPGERKSVAIARDPRHHSAEFAALCARVMAAAGFEVHLFPEPRSTPLLSFAVRHFGCDCGIMITASHNPPSDNGFKCYAPTGGQVIPPDDSGIIGKVGLVADQEIPEKDFDEALRDGSIKLEGKSVDDAYIAAVVSQSISRDRDLSIVYTPLHGVGETSCVAALHADGFTKVNILDSQRRPDGDFPNVPGHVSNPEIPKTMDAAIAEAKATGADLVLASDPDADRIGAAVPVGSDKAGPWTTLDGNQIGALLSAFVVKELKAQGKLRPENYIITTLVTSQMSRAIATREGIRVEDDLLVGFKWICSRMDTAGPANFIFGYEESHGYLRGDHVRDKDAGVAAMLFAELAATAKARGSSVLQYLDSLYLEVGHFGERLINKTLEGREGAGQIKKLMAAFRDAPPREIAGLAVTEVRDYKLHRTLDVRTGTVTDLPQPSGDLLIFHLDAEGTRFAARPSGTEPKIKFYLFARTDTSDLADSGRLAERKKATSERLDRMTADIEAYIAQVLAN